MSARFGVIWPDGSITGDITDSYRLAAAYARNHDGTVYTADVNGNPTESHGVAENAQEAA